MAIRAIVFDIGGVLEITPDPRMQATSARWDARLKRTPGDLDAKMAQLWQAGSLGQCSEADVARGLCELGGLSQDEADAYMADLWRAYLGTLNVDLTDYFRGLRPRYQTGIISNSFVGTREREQALYQFEQMADPIIYSHEVGIAKPDPRIYEMACDRMSVRPAEMIFLDDAEVCVTAANDLGIHGILFRETSQAIAAIEACLRANA